MPLLRVLLLLARFTGLPRLVWRLLLDPRVPLKLKLLLPVAIAYLILPFDIVPDAVPVLGRIDDLVVLVGSLFMFFRMIPRDVIADHLTGGGRRNPSRDDGPQSDDPVIEGSYRIVDDEDEAEP